MDTVFPNANCFYHSYPVWGDRADSRVYMKVEDESLPFFEQLWIRMVTINKAEVCCIPAYARGISLGDILEVSGSFVVKLVQVSGRSVFRAWSEDGWKGKHDILHSLAEAGALMETCTERLLAIDAEDLTKAADVRKLLEVFESSGQIVYETGWD